MCRTQPGDTRLPWRSSTGWAIGDRKARLIAVLLVMHLAAERYKTMSPDRSSSDKYAAQSLRRQRVDLLGKLREASGAEGLAHRARAIALIGFKLFRQPEPPPDHAPAAR
jgi:hypothetical protein